MSYEERLGFPCDFKVKYQFCEESEGGRTGSSRARATARTSRSKNDDIRLTGLYMIWPEFEDGAGGVFPENHVIPKSGTARMWVVADEARRVVHRKVRPGARGFFVEQGRKTAEVVITAVVGLQTNPPASDPGNTPAGVDR